MYSIYGIHVLYVHPLKADSQRCWHINIINRMYVLYCYLFLATVAVLNKWSNCNGLDQIEYMDK